MSTFGIYRATVVTNIDPENRLRIKVRCAALFGAAISAWCWPCVPSGPSINAPAIGKGVWIMLEAGSIDHPVWLGVFEDQSALVGF
jgi:hypothetical protein